MTTVLPTDVSRLRTNAPVLGNRSRPVEELLSSELLSLMHSSDVNKIDKAQIQDAHAVLAMREQSVRDGRAESHDDWLDVLAVQRRIVERHLRARADRFGSEQVEPLEQAGQFAEERRDTFLIIKFMDEAPHIRATLASLLTQTDLDLSRVVVVAVNNNSNDGSDQIIQDTAEEISSRARVVCINQSVPGGGSAARYGTDRVLATIRAMCEFDGNWSRLQRCRVAVTDGDTVYHHHVVRSLSDTFDDQPLVDGAMPFLIYKLTAALRFFADTLPLDIERLAELAAGEQAVASPVSLSTTVAQEHYPRSGRTVRGEELELVDRNGWTLRIPLTLRTPDGRRFGVLADSDGAQAFALEDGTLALYRAPVSGFDAALLALENGRIRRDEKWKWHAMIGHDLFLLELFQHGGVPASLIAPDTSDALKMFRAWALAIGGQHQLSRPGLKIVTGTDYQSGRVLQAAGCLTVLGDPHAWSETEVDRLAKMVRNFANEQSVFYGDTRSRGFERASGLYLHMTRIQGHVEAEVAGYSDEFFEQIAFPERIVFPLRWLLQNALCCYSASDERVRSLVETSVLIPMIGADGVQSLRAGLLSEESMSALHALPFEARRDEAERLAESIIVQHYRSIMVCYRSTLARFFARHGVEQETCGWLLEGLEAGRNALAEARPATDPGDVWRAEDFQIDEARGQVIGMTHS